MKNKYTIAAVVSNYNHSKFFSKSLIPIFEQTIPFDEILICDDSSNDKSHEKLKTFKKKFPNIQVFYNENNKGNIKNFNFMISKLKSDYVFLASSNDVYQKNIVQIFHNSVNNFADLGIICAKSCEKKFNDLNRKFKINSNLINSREISPIKFKELIKRKRFRFYSGANILRKRDFIKFGLLNENLKWNADWFIYYIFALNTNLLKIDNLVTEINVSNQ